MGVIVSKMLTGLSAHNSALGGMYSQVKSAIFAGAVSSSRATRRMMSKIKVMIPKANIVIAPVFSLLLSCSNMTSQIGRAHV